MISLVAIRLKCSFHHPVAEKCLDLLAGRSRRRCWDSISGVCIEPTVSTPRHCTVRHAVSVTMTSSVDLPAAQVHTTSAIKLNYYQLLSLSLLCGCDRLSGSVLSVMI